MLTITDQVYHILSTAVGRDATHVLASKFGAADPSLTCMIDRRVLENIIASSIVECDSLGLLTEGSVLIYSTLMLGAVLHVDGEVPFSEPLSILRDISVSAEVRQEQAIALLTDLDKSLPPHMRDMAVIGILDLEI